MPTKKLHRFLDGLKFKDYKITPLSGGYVNNTFLIETPSEKMILKQYLGMRTSDQISGEVEFLNHLSLKNFPIPSPQKVGEEFVHLFEDAIMVFSKYMPGNIKCADELNEEEIANALEIISEIHEYSKNLKITNIKKRRDMFTFDFEDWVDTYIEDKIPPFFEETISIKNVLKEKLGKKLDLFEIFPIHNDLVLQNLKFNENKLCAILDFDDFCEGARISDFSNFTLDACILGEDLDLDRLKKCLSKYNSLQDLTEEEIKIFPLMILHRLVMYIYFMYYNYLSKGNEESLKKSENYYAILKNLIGKEIEYRDKKIKFEI